VKFTCLTLPVLSIALAVLLAAGNATAGSILFIGNSFTHAYGSPVLSYRSDTVTDLNHQAFGGVPALFKSFTAQSGMQYDVYLETEPGVSLDWHVDHRLGVIGQRPWDIVVLQGYGSLDPRKPRDAAVVSAAVRQLAEFLRIRNPAVDMRLMATWSSAEQTYDPHGAWYGKPIEAMASDLRTGYDLAAKGAPGINSVVPVGEAWSRAMRAGVADPNPHDGIDAGKVNLWAADRMHASTYGYYLEALVLFGSITGRDPRSLGDGECSGFELGLSPAQIRALQQVAFDQLAAEGVRTAPQTSGQSAAPSRCARADGKSEALPYGLASRTAPTPYLRMPHDAHGKLPLLLSQTGAFSVTRNLVPSPGLIPYDLVVPFWSDGATKSRWVAVPNERIKYSPTGDWVFPPGTVFVKTFELSTDAANPGVRRRLETRLLVCDSGGGVYGVVYKWRPDNSDAELLSTSRTEEIAIKAATGEVRSQTWYYPSRQDCLACHNANTSGVLGVKARQMNRAFVYPSGVTDNELRAWNHIGLFAPEVNEADLATLPTLAAAGDASRSLQDRARSYLDANCSQCHRPGGTVAYFDARYDTPLEKQELIDGPVLIDQGIDRPRVISPHDVWRSIMFMRVNTVDDIKMPPIARETIDQKGVQLLRDWITSLPGRPVLEPPAMSPAGGTFSASIEISLTDSEPGADIRYTLDGSVPGLSDARYAGPIKLDSPAVLRARAFKDGFTRSITAQEVFIVGK
jgi:uncharacterized repeat protein (TIGR03806 family)